MTDNLNCPVRCAEGTLQEHFTEGNYDRYRKSPTWMPAEERFWRKVDKTDSCWTWIGTKDSQGYGRFVTVDRKRESAHRFSYALHSGPIPGGMCVCHHCDNPGCVNPDHLFLGTKADNARDAMEKGRNTFGSRNGRALLTERDVVAIRQSRVGKTIRELARLFGVSTSQIQRIVKRQAWNKIFTEQTTTKGEHESIRRIPEQIPVGR